MRRPAREPVARPRASARGSRRLAIGGAGARGRGSRRGGAGRGSRRFGGSARARGGSARARQPRRFGLGLRYGVTGSRGVRAARVAGGGVRPRRRMRSAAAAARSSGVR